MTDLQLAALIVARLNARFAEAGHAMRAKQNYGPIEHGADSAPMMYLHRIGSPKPYGSPRRHDEYDQTAGAMRQTREQQWSAVWQLTSYSPQSIADLAAPTAADLLAFAVDALTAEPFLDQLAAQGAGLLAPTNAGGEYLLGDYDRFIFWPHIDMTFVYSTVQTETGPGASAIKSGIYRV